MMCNTISDTYQNLIENLKKGVLLLEKGLNAVFTQKFNPFYYHGALPKFFLWTLYVSGLILFAYYRPTLEGAYDSMEYMTKTIPSGALFRALHRYASDAMMIFVILHVLRVWFTDRYREYRILPWLTGIILLVVMFISGLTGYMLIWDADSLALTNITLNWVSAVPGIGHSLAQLLIGGDIINQYTLPRFLFLHFAFPVSMLFFLWLHYLRITRPVVTAPTAVNLLLFGGLLLTCGLFPVGLEGRPPTDFSIAGTSLEINWFYMLPQGLMANGASALYAWAVVVAIPAVLLILPYIQKKSLRGDYAHVAFENCTGCQLCYHDCPYEAIEMVDRDDDTKFKRLAVVDPGRCSNCGLCVGACAFKAIEVPRRDTVDVIKEIQLALA